MGTTKSDIRHWFMEGRRRKARWMIVVCDTFDYEDYPVYCKDEESFWDAFDKYDGQNMQRIIEVYDLNRDRKDQVESNNRVFNMPKRRTAT